MNTDELSLCDVAGCVGALDDDLPMLTTSHVRPYVIATLLHRGAVRPVEVMQSLTPHCRMDDLRIGEWDPLDEEWCEDTRLSKLVDEVLGELVSEGTVRYNEEQDLWVLTSKNLSTIISWVSSLGAKMPQHILLELSRDQRKRVPDYVPLD